ncbi:isopentenyl-diphosphate delta-isomerase [Candidatus Gottesmanbacteria bacterium RIFCSPLOWO2_01_FULL_46_9]|uniref:Isopentenyl-diphosphate delta-isomerase n=1 Tax=Candidatus Gottesmanbacteria bacterium RIFCSPLOWO2_01_FULL_46_9 TaxID=1798394 RepID=A0A1F6B3J1_9BACT|nr:MAG: isopentenyl-diphosphate delta-isomerase [Candidatus Gottesmanbacteria bacterium RIFCSPLOWO2_01_FULL_46_9]
MEYVVLVNEKNTVLGKRPKQDVHSTHTPLHRGFSLFLFNTKKQLLITRRAHTKKTFPGVWTNTVCGHPAPGESVIKAAKRRLNDELGIVGVNIREVSPYRYRFADGNGVVENEICPILVAYSDVKPKVNAKEVAEWKWIAWTDFLRALKQNPQVYSPWCREEAAIIEKLHILYG